MKIGSIVQSKYRLSNGKEGNLGVVLKIADPYTANYQSAPKVVARVFYPKTHTHGWVDLKDMKVIA